MVRKNKIPMATASRGRRRSELERYVEYFSASRKVERDLCEDGSSKNHCERKDEKRNGFQAAAKDEKQEQKRGMIIYLLEAPNPRKSNEVERKLGRFLWEYIEAFNKERPQLIMKKFWQLI